MGQIANRQSLVFSKHGQLSQAIPQVRVEGTLHQRTPVARFGSQRNERRVYEDRIPGFRGRHDRQRTPVIRIAALTLASDSAITLAQFRPSKLGARYCQLGASLLLCILQCFRAYEACFRQVRVEQAVLLPGALLHVRKPLHFLAVLPNPTCARSHFQGFPTTDTIEAEIITQLIRNQFCKNKLHNRHINLKTIM